jgi:hypothetical protein
MAWALSIFHPDDRPARIEILVRWWKNQDPKALRAWMDWATQLTPEQKRYFLAQ